MNMQVAAFTDTYFPSINGVTYTIHSWRREWQRRGGEMSVVYPRKNGYEPDDSEFPVRSLPFPFYDDFQLGLPQVPDSVSDPDVIHVHGQFTVGLGGLRLARRTDVPIVATYHMPGGQYADYLAPTNAIARGIERVTRSYENWFFEHADMVLTPSEATRKHLKETIGVETPAQVLPNGIDTNRFQPVDPSSFLERHGVDTDKPIIGYTGRLGHEKRLWEIIDAVTDLDVKVLFGGDGPARANLVERAEELGVDASFLGFLEREELPAFYSALDVFAFPSPIETQGLVALESYACGTPVVGVHEGGLEDTVDHGETGYHYESGDTNEFADRIEQALEENDRLRENCLGRRDGLSVEAAIDELTDVYRQVVEG